jgi:hypothetical protein
VCFTAWPESEGYIEVTFDERYMSYLVWGEEVCPDTKKNHLQGYVEFRIQQFSTLSKSCVGGRHVISVLDIRIVQLNKLLLIVRKMGPLRSMEKLQNKASGLNY